MPGYLLHSAFLMCASLQDFPFFLWQFSIIIFFIQKVQTQCGQAI